MSGPARDLLVSTSAAKTRLSELIRACAARDVRLLRYGAPVAVLVDAGRYDALCDRLALLEAVCGTEASAMHARIRGDVA